MIKKDLFRRGARDSRDAFYYTLMTLFMPVQKIAVWPQITTLEQGRQTCASSSRSAAESPSDRPRSGRPPKVRKGVMKNVRMLITKTACWDAEGVRDFIKKMTGVGYNPTCVRGMMRKWGFSMKVPVMRHVSRASRRRIAKFKKQMKKIQDEAGGGGGVDGGRPRRVDRRGRFEAPKVGGGGEGRGSARWDAGGPHTRTTDPTPGPPSSGLPLPTKGDSSSGMRHLPRSSWTFWRRYASGSARP